MKIILKKKKKNLAYAVQKCQYHGEKEKAEDQFQIIGEQEMTIKCSTWSLTGPYMGKKGLKDIIGIIGDI